MARSLYLALSTLLTWFTSVSCLDNGVALTPPMGWLSWERYRCTTDCNLYPTECISEWLFRNITDLMVSEGYAAAGYEYIIIDDCWLDISRDNEGKLQPDPKRFPTGIKALADYVHSKGLKFGIYEDIGTKTCAGYPGSGGHLEVDARTFAEWGVDYVKLDGCYTDIQTMEVVYPEFGRYLNKTGRPIVYSCSWPAYQIDKSVNWKSIAEHCNLWRVYGDIDDSWSSVYDIMYYFGKRHDLAQYAGPGHWNDPDMLVIGNFGLSVWQAEAQMAVWAVLAAPLIMSVDLAHVEPEFKQILQNKRAIAINQDPFGIQGKKIISSQDIHVWSRPIAPKVQENFSYALAFVSNRTDGMPYRYISTLNDLGLHNPSGYVVHDVFRTSYSGNLLKPETHLEVRIIPTGVVFIQLTAVSPDSDIKGKTASEPTKSPSGSATSRYHSLELIFVTSLLLSLQIVF